MAVTAGRHSAHYEGDFVVFLIGMRVNKPLHIRSWWPVFTAMRPMVKELEAQPDLGLLSANFGFMFGGPTLVQYWRSFDDLFRYARDPGQGHLPAWKAFNQRARASGAVGIWHETYKVRDGEYENIYGNMPPIGLAEFGERYDLGSSGR